MGNSYYNICKHDGLTMQSVKGDGITTNDYVQFKCGACNMNCYQYRQRGQFFNGPWYPWQPKDENSKKNIGDPQYIGSSNSVVCLHSNMKVTGSQGNTGQGMFQLVTMTCPECNLNCKFERQMGTIYHGSWQKAGSLLVL